MKHIGVYHTTSDNRPALYTTKGKAEGRLKTHYDSTYWYSEAKVVKVKLSIVEEE